MTNITDDKNGVPVWALARLREVYASDDRLITTARAVDLLHLDYAQAFAPDKPNILPQVFGVPQPNAEDVLCFKYEQFKNICEYFAANVKPKREPSSTIIGRAFEAIEEEAEILWSRFTLTQDLFVDLTSENLEQILSRSAKVSEHSLPLSAVLHWIGCTCESDDSKLQFLGRHIRYRGAGTAYYSRYVTLAGLHALASRGNWGTHEGRLKCLDTLRELRDFDMAQPKKFDDKGDSDRDEAEPQAGRTPPEFSLAQLLCEYHRLTEGDTELRQMLLTVISCELRVPLQGAKLAPKATQEHPAEASIRRFLKESDAVDYGPMWDKTFTPTVELWETYTKYAPNGRCKSLQTFGLCLGRMLQKPSVRGRIETPDGQKRQVRGFYGIGITADPV